MMARAKELPLPSADKLWTHLRITEDKDLKAKGFTILAGPYAEREAELLRTVVLDADRSGRHLGYSENKQGEVFVWQRSKRL